MLTLHSNYINHTVEIREGFEVDYTPNQPYVDYQNYGKWGRIVNSGNVVKSMPFNVNRWKGEDCYTEVISAMQTALITFK